MDEWITWVLLAGADRLVKEKKDINSGKNVQS